MKKPNVCKTCGKVWDRDGIKRFYCSKDCQLRGEWGKINKSLNIGRDAWNKGIPAPWARFDLLHTPEAIKKMSESKKGKPSPKKGIPQLQTRGENNPNWKGGTGTERHQAMGKIEYKLWREAVFKRDKYTCVMCLSVGGYLHADHIKTWEDYPELRYAIDNGRTLCSACHYFVTFGRKMPEGMKWGVLKEVNLNAS